MNFPFSGHPPSLPRASVAAARQGKQQELRRRFMRTPLVAEEASVLRVAADIGIDVDRLARDMASPDVQADSDRTRALADISRVCRHARPSGGTDRPERRNPPTRSFAGLQKTSHPYRSRCADAMNTPSHMLIGAALFCKAFGSGHPHCGARRWGLLQTCWFAMVLWSTQVAGVPEHEVFGALFLLGDLAVGLCGGSQLSGLGRAACVGDLAAECDPGALLLVPVFCMPLRTS